MGPLQPLLHSHQEAWVLAACEELQRVHHFLQQSANVSAIQPQSSEVQEAHRTCQGMASQESDDVMAFRWLAEDWSLTLVRQISFLQHFPYTCRNFESRTTALSMARLAAERSVENGDHSGAATIYPLWGTTVSPQSDAMRVKGVSSDLVVIRRLVQSLT